MRWCTAPGTGSEQGACITSFIYFPSRSNAKARRKPERRWMLERRQIEDLPPSYIVCCTAEDPVPLENPHLFGVRSVGETMESGEASPISELLSPPPPPLPESVKRTGKRARDWPLLFGAQLIKHDDGKDDELVEAAPQGAEAIVPCEPSEKPPPPAAAAAAVQVDKAKLYCSLCGCALTPPIYQCPVGHLACCSCRVKLPGRRCRTCRDRGAAASAVSAYAHCPGLDLFFADLRVPCDFDEYGCGAVVPYFLSANHKSTCEHAPCHCPEPGCALLFAPRGLAAHLDADHHWPVYDVAYGTPLPLAVPVTAAPAAAAASASVSSGPAPARDVGVQLLRGEDSSLFVMAVGPLGDGAAVSVVLVRAMAKPPPFPRFTCTFYANPPPGAAADLAGGYFFATVPVRSSALAGGDGVAPEKELYFAVPKEMLCERSRELFLSVRVDRSSGPEPPMEDKKMITES